MPATNPKVDKYFARTRLWREESLKLRQLALATGLSEDLKWGKPCYALNGANVVIIQAFKNYCALLFFKGALLKDPHDVLIKTGANTHAGRQIRFTSLKEITASAPAIKACIKEAIHVEKSGLKVPPKDPALTPVPPEFEQKLNKLPALKAAFHSLTPGRQRSYLFYFSGSRQSKTRAARIDKHIARILDGKGLDD